MNDQPTSGNRWEPQPGDPAETAPLAVTPAAPVAPAPVPIEASPTATLPAEPTQAPGTRASLLTRARVKLVAVAAAIFLVGGAGGFGIAKAAQHDDGGSTPAPGQGTRNGFDGNRGPGQGPDRDFGGDRRRQDSDQGSSTT